MYFETQMHTRRNVDGPDHAARLLHAEEVRSFEALVWRTQDGREIAVVADNHCNDPWFEAAVLDLTNGTQIESLTIGWMKSMEQKAQYLRDCETADYVMRRDVSLPMDGEGGDTKAHFECGCCGDSFESTYDKQRVFDQDAGYGICPECCGMYAR